MDEFTQFPVAFASKAEILAAGIVLPIVCITIGVLRFATRHLQRMPFTLDDWLIIPAVVFITGMGICFIVGYKLDVMGVPTPFDDLPKIQTQSKIIYSFEPLMTAAYGFTKLSILYFYRRVLAAHAHPIFNWISYIYISIVTVWMVGFFLQLIFSCGSRFDLQWSLLSEEVEKYCINATPARLALAVSDFILDVLIIILPLPMIWRMNITPVRKIGLTAVFMIGLMAIAASIARMVIFIIVSNPSFGVAYDIGLALSTMEWWSLIETALSAIAACLPNIMFLAKKFYLMMGNFRVWRWKLDVIGKAAIFGFILLVIATSNMVRLDGVERYSLI